MTLAPVPAPSDEHRRGARRERTLRACKVYYGPTMIEVDGMLTDLSDGGGRIRLPADVLVPKKVWVLEMRSGVASEAEVMWRRPPLIGVRFVSPAAPDGAADTVEARLLKRIWMSLKV